MTEIKTTEELVNELLGMKARIEEILAQIGVNPQKESRDIKKCLMRLGILPNVKGFAYLTTAIEMCIKDPNIIGMVTKKLYPDIAVKYDTTASRVERAIRHAIETGMMRTDEDLVNEIFTGRKKLTNSEFIATLADYLR